MGPDFQAKAGNFSSGTGIVGSTVVVNTVGFRPKVLIIWSTHTTANNTANGSPTRCVGFATSASDRRCIAALSQNAVNPSNEAVTYRDDTLALLMGVSATQGRMDVQSFDSSGFTLVVDEVFSASIQISYLALGGAKLTNAATFQFQEPGSTGTQSITSLAFEPTTLILLAAGGGTTTPPAWQDHSIMSVGFADATGAVVLAQAGKDNVNPGVQRSYIRSGECIALYDTGLSGTDARASFSGFTSTGFDLSWAERASSRWVFGLALQGPSSFIGNLTASTTLNTTQAQTGFGFTPKAVLGMADRNGQSSSDTPVSGDRSWSFGGFSEVAAASRFGAASMARDNLAVQSCNRGMRTDTWIYTTTPGTGTLGQIDIDSIDATGFTTIIDDPDTAMFIPYLALG